MTRLLLADDSELIRTRLSGLLKAHAGANEVDTADSLEKALHAVSILPPDLLILDLNFPDGNALSIIPLLKRMVPRMRIAVLSNDASPFTGERCRQAGADWFFDKSTEFEEVLALAQDAATLHAGGVSAKNGSREPMND